MSHAEVPQVEPSQVEVSQVEVSQVEVSQVEVSQVETPLLHSPRVGGCTASSWDGSERLKRSKRLVVQVVR
ncbi:hypothetical protein A7K94_0201710 [Modestobacter sp. VKM Ac-2676]|nr:hypothetical protein A7K94_0201710 [Modestobacter sp. VKM Ac-2676]